MVTTSLCSFGPDSQKDTATIFQPLPLPLPSTSLVFDPESVPTLHTSVGPAALLFSSWYRYVRRQQACRQFQYAVLQDNTGEPPPLALRLLTAVGITAAVLTLGTLLSAFLRPHVGVDSAYCRVVRRLEVGSF